MGAVHDAEPTAPRGSRASSLLGPALALPVLAAVVVGAGAARPAWGGDGAWTTPLEILLAVLALALVAALVLVVRSLPGGLPRAERGSTRRRWWILGAAAAIAILAWLSGVAARDPMATDADGGDLGVLPGLSGGAGEPLPLTTTAVVAGLLALAVMAVLATLLASRQIDRRPASSDAGTAAPAAAPTADDATVPTGPPDEVVLATWAIARRAVVAWLDGGEHDPPGGLLRRVAGTQLAAPLRRLTDLYLPVRYGRRRATADDAQAARRALADLLCRLSPRPPTGGRP